MKRGCRWGTHPGLRVVSIWAYQLTLRYGLQLSVNNDSNRPAIWARINTPESGTLRTYRSLLLSVVVFVWRHDRPIGTWTYHNMSESIAGQCLLLHEIQHCPCYLIVLVYSLRPTADTAHQTHIQNFCIPFVQAIKRIYKCSILRYRYKTDMREIYNTAPKRADSWQSPNYIICCLRNSKHSQGKE